jgi:hypothetical protein
MRVHIYHGLHYNRDERPFFSMNEGGVSGAQDGGKKVRRFRSSTRSRYKFVINLPVSVLLLKGLTSQDFLKQVYEVNFSPCKVI